MIGGQSGEASAQQGFGCRSRTSSPEYTYFPRTGGMRCGWPEQLAEQLAATIANGGRHGNPEHLAEELAESIANRVAFDRWARQGDTDDDDGELGPMPNLVNDRTVNQSFVDSVVPLSEPRYLESFSFESPRLAYVSMPAWASDSHWGSTTMHSSSSRYCCVHCVTFARCWCSHEGCHMVGPYCGTCLATHLSGHFDDSACGSPNWQREFSNGSRRLQQCPIRKGRPGKRSVESEDRRMNRARDRIERKRFSDLGDLDNTTALMSTSAEDQMTVVALTIDSQKQVGSSCAGEDCGVDGVIAAAVCAE